MKQIAPNYISKLNTDDEYIAKYIKRRGGIKYDETTK
jgi:hypothetical protein